MGMAENNYKLALKFFLNRELNKSYDIIKQVFQESFQQYENRIIDLNLFSKILILYLTEVGLAIESGGDNVRLVLERKENDQVRSWIRENSPLKELKKTFGGICYIPSDVIYNLFLVYYILFKANIVLGKELESNFKEAFVSLDTYSNQSDENIINFANLYVFKVLPDLEKSEEAVHIIRESSFFASDVDSALRTLSDEKEQRVEQRKVEERRQKEQQKRLQDKRNAEMQKQEEVQKKQDLKYKTLNQIKANLKGDKKLDAHPFREESSTEIAQLKHRIHAILSIAKCHFKENIILYLLLVVSLLLSSKVPKIRNGNLMQRLKDTMKMAVKVTYL